MKTAIAKWGNSLAVRLPRHLTEGVNLSEGSPVEIRVEGQNLLICATRPRQKLSDLLRKHQASQQHDEVDWGQPKGDEAW
ncbi:MAG TPA: AbrB/MazE/SpoVT family DNA-binding domain-containing protein [Alphaproteobacteria bacterium]|jgi:antitoxin MazE|nr:AbrB/MazE/SpoVT family DNA-binding domain-containing protein [Alphaproteobacteria bacterium]MDP6268885.1 AbrB/MazE/SpoVT family DNA-binding domain-containing protein [Alphaproteobacteria bacterium]MDP7164219.1 AbrB/MazE/SpoVT family DNA-binding domain-containing protein [Alphaproteobacteria bacterium]MDP7429659.1 AbrB/MazE/SpoVT family DNA-binding domain-containing protein [Alphaproteobacteria bacterium]HJM50886.1 AbrB/MazE/SpoVT family DNA-binding domain-containing protein [Alphaproteobacte